MYGVQIAFRNYTAVNGITGSPWVGLKNFREIFTMPVFWTMIRNTVLINVYNLLWGFPVPIILALMLNEVNHTGYKKLVQNVTYIPHFISTVVLVGMIIECLSPTYGFVNKFIKILGGETIEFMQKHEYFRTIYIFSGIWKSAGWSSIIYLSALSSIDMQMYEAAKIDGASRLKCIWHINIPSILPTIVILLILRTGEIMNVGFEKIYLMQNSLNLEVSEVISTYVYKIGLLRAKYSFTTAIDLFNSVINFILLVIVNHISKKVTEIGIF